MHQKKQPLVTLKQFYLFSYSSLYLCAASLPNGDPKMIKLLRKYGARYPFNAAASLSPVKKAIIYNNIPQLMVLLDIMRPADKKNSSLIMNAIVKNEIEAVKLLLKAGQDINYITPDGNSALKSACFFNKDNSQLPMVELILKNASIIEPVSQTIEGPIHWLCRSKSPQIARLFFEYAKSTINFYRIDEHGKLGPSLLANNSSVYENDIIELLEIIISNGFNINYYNPETNTETVLESFVSSIEKPPQIIQWLLDHGADPYLPIIRKPVILPNNDHQARNETPTTNKTTIFQKALKFKAIRCIFEDYAKTRPMPSQPPK